MTPGLRLSPRLVVRLLFAVAGALASPLAAATAHYAYVGAAYTAASAPYMVGERLTGTLDLAAPLPPFQTLADIRDAIADFSFDDGVAVRTFADSVVCSFQVATDGAGEITAWSILIRQSGVAAGDALHSIDSSRSIGIYGGIDLGGTGTAPANACDGMALATSGSTATPGVWAAAAPLPSSPTTYTYTGAPYTHADPPYALGGHLAGSFTLANPLPAFRARADLAPALVAFSFDDGVEVRTLANSFVCSFQVGTDGAGRIASWRLSLRRFPYTPGDPHAAIDSSGEPGIFGGSDLAGTGTAPVGPCDGMALTTYASSSALGSWTSDHPLPSDPTVYTYTGDPYTVASPPYSAGGHLAATLTLANPLPPFLPATDLRPAIAAFTYDDGVAIRTLPDSFVCAFEVATDGAGRISEWRVSLRQFPYTPGDPQHSIDSSARVGVFGGIDLAGSGPADVNPCGALVLAPSASVATPGTWTSDHPLPSRPTTYHYLGDPYTHADPPYAPGGRLVGTLELANPLPPNRPLFEIAPAILDLSFADGVQTRTLADSFLCGFAVATDGLGQIVDWRVHLRRFPYLPGEEHPAIDSFSRPSALEGFDLAGSGPAPVDPCGAMALAPFASTASEGTWTSDRPPAIAEVPALGAGGRAALALLLATIGLAALARRRRLSSRR